MHLNENQLRNGCTMNMEEWLWLNRTGCFEDASLMKFVAPFPPKELMYIVGGLTNEKDFAAHGCDIYKALTEASPSALTDYEKILDFGCGSGRLARMFKGHPKQVFGCDIDMPLVKWTQKNLDFMQVTQSEIYPPLPYPDNFFDAIISISVFTHLNESSQDEFLNELHRVSVDEAKLFITVHGRQAMDRAKSEKEIFDMLCMEPDLFRMACDNFDRDQHAFVLQQGHLTTKHFNYGIAFISEAYVRSHWVQWFDIIDFRPGAIHSFQDIIVLSAR